MALVKRVDQSHIVANGDVAAGDIHKTFYVFNGQKRTNLWEACERLQKGVNESAEKKQFIEKLAQFMSDAEDGSVQFRSLEEKLTAGGMKKKSNRASRLKERFSKKLEAASFNELIQEVYALILVEIDTGFEHKVRPHIEANEMSRSNRETFSIYESIESQLHGTTDITKEDLEGMLYYLAGKCYIDWDRQ